MRTVPATAPSAYGATARRRSLYSQRVERLFDDRWREKSLLTDGRQVELRMLKGDDAPLLAAGFGKLSPVSRYRRFHGTRGQLTADELRYLTELDSENHFALGALDALTGEGLGVARFVRLPREPTVAEPALTVIDPVQRKGLGRLLLLRLAAAAEERGVESFRFLVLASNEPMRDLLKQIALAAEQKRDGDVLQFDVPLAQLKMAIPPLEPGHPLHEFLVAAATGALLLADIVEHVRHWLVQHSVSQQHDEAR